MKILNVETRVLSTDLPVAFSGGNYEIGRRSYRPLQDHDR